jgi:membrane protease subunit HflK
MSAAGASGRYNQAVTEGTSMPWSNQGGGGGGWQGGGGNRGPWGQGPRGGGGQQPPNLEELLRRGQDRFRGMLPGGADWGGRTILVGIAILFVIWLATGLYRVEPDEQGVVLRFGKFTTTTQPGLNYHLPYPIETVITPRVTTVNRVDVGFVAQTPGRGISSRDINEESLMLTGDENIVDIDFTVFWVIKDPTQFLFNTQNPEATVKAVAESAMREIVGKTPIQSALTEGRAAIEQATQKLMQETLDGYGTGVLIRQVQMQKVDPPAAVIDAFRDVQAARADLERSRNEAEAYANDIIPRARGEAEQLIQQSEAYRQEVVARSQGEAARFTSVYNEYARAKDVTAERIYLETMEQVLKDMNKVIVDEKAGNGVVPYLPLPEVQKRTSSSTNGGGQ